MPESIPELISKALGGDELAISELVELHRGAVFGLAYRMLGQREDAEDVVQETFVRAFRNLHRFDVERELRPWLLAIAGNRCRSLLGQRMRRPGASGLVEHLPDRDGRGRGFEGIEEEVTRALGGLREEYRQAFVLFHDQQLSYAEIAVALDCPVGTVKTWVHRARRELGAELRRRGVVAESRHEVR